VADLKALRDRKGAEKVRRRDPCPINYGRPCFYRDNDPLCAQCTEQEVERERNGGRHG
jgi:hypothetical protein